MGDYCQSVLTVLNWARWTSGLTQYQAASNVPNVTLKIIISEINPGGETETKKEQVIFFWLK